MAAAFRTRSGARCKATSDQKSPSVAVVYSHQGWSSWSISRELANLFALMRADPICAAVIQLNQSPHVHVLCRSVHQPRQPVE
jgi:hypothetical protein